MPLDWIPRLARSPRPQAPAPVLLEVDADLQLRILFALTGEASKRRPRPEAARLHVVERAEMVGTELRLQAPGRAREGMLLVGLPRLSFREDGVSLAVARIPIVRVLEIGARQAAMGRIEIPDAGRFVEGTPDALRVCLLLGSPGR